MKFALGENILSAYKTHSPRALGLVNNFRTMLSYAVSSATPESFTSFSLIAMHISCFPNNSSSSSNACNKKNLLFSKCISAIRIRNIIAARIVPLSFFSRRFCIRLALSELPNKKIKEGKESLRFVEHNTKRVVSRMRDL